MPMHAFCVVFILSNTIIIAWLYERKKKPKTFSDPFRREREKIVCPKYFDNFLIYRQQSLTLLCPTTITNSLAFEDCKKKKIQRLDAPTVNTIQRLCWLASANLKIFVVHRIFTVAVAHVHRKLDSPLFRSDCSLPRNPFSNDETNETIKFRHIDRQQCQTRHWSCRAGILNYVKLALAVNCIRY